MPKTFRVEYIVEPTSGAVDVLLRQVSEEPFVISEESTLAGAYLHNWLDQPRKLENDGTLDLQVLAVALQNPADRARFQVGREVVLLP